MKKMFPKFMKSSKKGSEGSAIEERSESGAEAAAEDLGESKTTERAEDRKKKKRGYLGGGMIPAKTAQSLKGHMQAGIKAGVQAGETPAAAVSSARQSVTPNRPERPNLVRRPVSPYRPVLRNDWPG